MTLKLFFTLILGLIALSPPATPQATARFPHLAEAEAFLAEGKPLDALNRAAKGLEYQPESIALLDLASLAAATFGAADISIWYANEALTLIGEEPDEPALEVKRAELLERLAGLDPLAEEGAGPFDRYAKSILKLSSGLIRKKLFANTVDLLHLLEHTRYASQAQQQLDKLFSNKKSVEALLDTGIDVPVKPTVKKSKKWLAKEDAQHMDWDQAHEFKTDNYKVTSNMGYEFAKTLSLAMEQMNHFFREIFQHKLRGGGTALCSINVHRTRAGFDRGPSGKRPPTVRGYFSPSKNAVTTYDPRSDGRSISSLWSTLFHEASHQFIHMVCPSLVPAWLNEGTACYFEGARLKASGIVEKNHIPRSRLRALPFLFKSEDIRLKDVISYFRPGSYDGNYYPVGWGLVYFFHNYENEQSERIYIPLYQKFLRSYKTGEKHDPFERFVEIFVKKAGVNGITLFEEFETFFEAWILDLHELAYGPADQAADRLMARARRQRDNKALAYAKDSYQWALEKRPDDLPALFELAEVLAGLKNKDGAIYYYRKALAEARSRHDPETILPGMGQIKAGDLVSTCFERIAGLEKSIPKTLGQADADLAEAAVELAKNYADQQMPRTAIHLLRKTISVLGGHWALKAQADQIQTYSNIDMRRWRRLPVWNNLKEWKNTDDWDGDGEQVIGQSDHLRITTYDPPLPDNYRFEVDIEIKDIERGVGAGLAFGVNNQTETKLFGGFSLNDTELLLVRLVEDPEIIGTLAPLKPKEMKKMTLAVQVTPGHAEFFLNGERISEQSFAKDELTGKVGLFIQSTEATFTELRVRY